jgi:hypothetical protein
MKLLLSRFVLGLEVFYLIFVLLDLLKLLRDKEQEASSTKRNFRVYFMVYKVIVCCKTLTCPHDKDQVKLLS